MSILSLPSTTDDVLLEELSASELFKYARTCKHIHAVVQSYIRRRFRIDKLLETFFTPSQIADFRRLQALRGMLISGSTALQFFNRVIYPDSDLDVYVEHAYREEIGLWLLAIGYEYAPRENSANKTFQDDLDRNLTMFFGDMDRTPQRHFIAPRADYISRQCVFTFVKQHPFRQVQIITSLNSPLESILSFHSTCVMNIITHNAAYSLFPRGTFTERRSLSCVIASTATVPHEKYRSRGWSIECIISRTEFDDPKSAFARGRRYVGDARCWTLPILPCIDTPALCNIQSHSWLVEYDRWFSPKLPYSVLQLPCLRSAYFIESEDGHLQAHIWEEMGDAIAEFESDDAEPRRFLDDEFSSFIDWYRAKHYKDSQNCELWAEIRAENSRKARNNFHSMVARNEARISSMSNMRRYFAVP